MVRYRIKELAKERQMTQFELAAKSKISLTVIQRLWQNRAPEGIRHNTLASIASALEVGIEDLFETGSEGSSGARGNRESLVPAAA